MFPERLFTASLKPQVVQLQSSEGLLLYTDGLIEAMNAQGEQLGSNAVRQNIEPLACDPSARVTDSLLALVDRHRAGHMLSDDLTLLSIRRKAQPTMPLHSTPTSQASEGSGS